MLKWLWRKDRAVKCPRCHATHVPLQGRTSMALAGPEGVEDRTQFKLCALVVCPGCGHRFLALAAAHMVIAS